MFVSRKIVSGKSLSKFSRVCFPLGKLINGKYFPVNEKYFSVKKILAWFSGKCFSF